MGRRRQQYRWINRATSLGDDPAHANRCRIVHAELESAKAALASGGVNVRIAEYVYIDRWRTLVGEWVPMMHAPRFVSIAYLMHLNAALWDEIRDMEHKIAFMRGELTRLSDPRAKTRQVARTRRQVQKRHAECAIREAREERRIAKNSDL